MCCSGQRAALSGGTTMHIDFVLPVEGDIQEGLRQYRQKAAIGCMDYGFHVAVTTWNEKVSKDMAEAVESGVNSFKFFLAYKVFTRYLAVYTECFHW
jgi:dihydropyrimidinase